MKKTAILLLTIFVSLIVTPIYVYAQSTAESEFNVMTYNLLGGHNGSELEHLAQYLKDNQIKVFAAQEGGGKDDKGDDSDRIVEKLRDIDYPMTMVRRDNYYAGKQLFILSAYPVISHEDARVSGGGISSGLFIARIDHPDIGPVDIYNQHVAQGRCDILLNEFGYNVQQKNNANHLLLGDLNMDLANDRHLEDDRAACIQLLRNDYTRSCQGRYDRDLGTDTVDRDRCPNTSINNSGIIDWITAKNNSNLEIVDSYIENVYFGEGKTFSDHYPVIATVKVTNFQCNLTTTVNPSVDCSPDGTEATIHWNAQGFNFQYDNIVGRFNGNPGQNECQNSSGEPAEWFCSRNQGEGEDFFTSFSPNQSSSIVAVSPGVTYGYRLSVDYTANGVRLPHWDTCTTPNVEFTCLNTIQPTVTPTATPTIQPTATPVPPTPSEPPTVDPDYNDNGYVDIQDYTTLITLFGQEVCDKNLVGSCILDILDYTALISSFGSS